MTEILKTQINGKRTHLYYSWNRMMMRCYNSNDPSYPNYGGKNISVCDEWRSFENFATFAHSQRYEEGNGLTIDRINPFGNYEPGNCLFSTRKEQNRNKKNTVRIEYQGEWRSLADWSEILGISLSTLQTRYYRAEERDPERLFRPAGKRSKPLQKQLPFMQDAQES